AALPLQTALSSFLQLRLLTLAVQCNLSALLAFWYLVSHIHSSFLDLSNASSGKMITVSSPKLVIKNPKPSVMISAWKQSTSMQANSFCLFLVNTSREILPSGVSRTVCSHHL